jgi:hypothetical protein
MSVRLYTEHMKKAKVEPNIRAQKHKHKDDLCIGRINTLYRCLGDVDFVG